MFDLRMGKFYHSIANIGSKIQVILLLPACFSLCLFSARISAQPLAFNFDYLKMEDGLLNNDVSCIYQDSQGFIWIGTKEGLNRYDGNRFMAFVHDPQDSTSLSNGNVLNILEDSSGKLWVGTSRGLNVLKEDQRGFKRYFHRVEEKTSLSHNKASSIYEDKNGQLWIGTGAGGLHLYNRKEDSFQRFPRSGKAELRSIVEAADGRLILGYGAWVLRRLKGGISLFDKKKKAYLDTKEEILTEDLSITSLSIDQQDNLWIGSYNKGFHHYQLKEKKLTELTKPVYLQQSSRPMRIYHLLESEEEVIFLATEDSGIQVFDKNGFSFLEIDLYSGTNGLSSKVTTFIFKDRTGIYWVGTGNEGINIYDSHKSQFNHLGIDAGGSNGLSGKSVLALTESKRGGLWIGLDKGGLNYYNKKTRQVKYFLHQAGNTDSPGENVVNGLLESSKGELLIGYYLRGFDILDVERNHFTHYDDQQAVEGATYIKCFFEEGADVLWLGSRQQGLIRFDRKTGQSVKYKHDPANDRSISHNHVSAIMPEDEASLWIGTFRGIGLFNKKEGAFKSWTYDPDDQHSISGIEVYTICKDNKGGLWIGTDNGLNYFDREQEQFIRYYNSDGLPSNTIKGILCDENNDLWISTNRGLSRFSIHDKTFKNYGFEDGLKGLYFNENAALKTSDGILMFGSTNGVAYFHPENIRSNPLPPPVVITEFLIHNKPVEIGGTDSPLEKHISRTKTVNLNYRQNVFTFEFAALSFTASTKNQYAYMLEGFEQEWNYVGDQKNATYTNIAPGNYTFRVKASNNDGIWNEEGTSIYLIILPPWWKTWWAYVLYLSLILVLIVGVRQTALYRAELLNTVKIERLEKEKASEFNRMKTNFFTNISHEFKTPLTLILGPLEKINASEQLNLKSGMRKQFALMQQNARRLLRLITLLIESQKNEFTGMKLHAAEDNIIPFLKEIIDAFDNMAKERQIQLVFTHQAPDLKLWFDREKLDIVLYNLLSNAFKYTNSGGSVEVSLTVEETALQGIPSPKQINISVRDSGKGIAPENLDKIFERYYKADQDSRGTGIGLFFSKSIIELHHGQISVVSELKKGSCFTISLPLGNKHLLSDEIAPSVPDFVQTVIFRPNIEPETIIPVHEYTAREPSEKANKPVVLIVEDNYDVLVFLRESLSPSYQIAAAFNGLEGLKVAGECHPDLIVSDIMMPEMDGIEFCVRIKSNLATSHIPVILLTAQSGDEKTFLGLESGADDFISKPFNPQLLEIKISNVIATRQMLKQRFRQELLLSPKEITVTSLDEQFMARVVELMEKHIDDPNFNIDVLVEKINMSRSPFFRKIKAITGQTPSEFIRLYKLKRGAQLLQQSGKTVAEIAYDLGYSSPKIFRMHFKRQFGQTPSEYKLRDRMGKDGNTPKQSG